MYVHIVRRKMSVSKLNSNYKDFDKPEENNAASNGSSYLQNHTNTTANLNTQITNQSLELEKKKFTLALLKNEANTYEELIKSLEDEKKTKRQNLKALQQQVFETRIKFSDELMSFAVNDNIEKASNDNISQHLPGPSNESHFDSGRPNEELDDTITVEWKMNTDDYTFCDEDDKIFEDLQLQDDIDHHGERKVKFIFKKPTTFPK